MPNRSATYATPSRGSRILVTSLACVVGLLAAWVLVANTILRESAPTTDVAAALLASRDAAPPTLSLLRVASAVSAVAPVPSPAEEPVVVPDVAVAEPAPTDPGPVAADAPPAEPTTEPTAIVLASAGAQDYTGALAPAPLPVGMPESVESAALEDAAAEPLDGLVPLPRKRPAADLVPLPRPRPEIETVASAAPVMTITDVEIEKHQPH